MLVDVVAHQMPPIQNKPPRSSPLALVFLGVVIVVVSIWAIEQVAATLGYAPQPDPALTLMISGLVGALAAAGARR